MKIPGTYLEICGAILVTLFAYAVWQPLALLLAGIFMLLAGRSLS